MAKSILDSVSIGEPIYADASPVTFRFYVTVDSASYTHTITIKNGSTTMLTLSLGSLSVGSTTKIVTLTSAQRTTLLNAMTNVARFNATYTLTTLNNGSTVGTSDYVGSIEVSSNSQPTVNAFTYADTNPATVALTGNNQTLVAGESIITLSNMSATAKNGATLGFFTVRTANSTRSASNIPPSTTSYVYAYTPRVISDTDRLSLQMTDSRGMVNSAWIDVNVIPYFAPSFTEYSIKRNGEDRTKANFVFSGSFATVLNNTVTLKYRYKEVGGSFGAYTTPTLTINNGTFSYTATGIGSFDVEKNYEFEVVLTDVLNSNTVSIILPTRDSLLSFRPNALGVGKVPNGDHIVEIADSYSLISAMPYVFSTNGGQTFSSFRLMPGYARIARVTFKSAPGQRLGPSIGVIRFRIESSREAEANVTMTFNMYPETIEEMNLSSYYALYYAQVPGSTYDDTSFFVQMVTRGTYDFYAQLNDTYDKLTVCTYIQELLKEYVEVTYEDAYIETASRPAASSTVKYGVEQGFGRLVVSDTLVNNGTYEAASSQYYSQGNYAINMNNSDIIEANGIYMHDSANAKDEGIIFMRNDNGNWDTLYAYDGEVYIRRNWTASGSAPSGIRLLSTDDIKVYTYDGNATGITNFWNSAITTRTSALLRRTGRTVMCYIRFASPSTATSGQAIATIPTGYRPTIAIATSAIEAWVKNANAPVTISSAGTVAFVNTAFTTSATYIICATWITGDAYPSS